MEDPNNLSFLNAFLQSSLSEARDFSRPYLKNNTEEDLNSVIQIFQAYFGGKNKEEVEQELNQYLTSLEPLNKFENVISTDVINNASILSTMADKKAGQRAKSKPWTSQEDDTLAKAIQDHGTNNWGVVAAIVANGRTRSQCSQRWNRVINPKISKANWSQEEIDKLMNAVQLYGEKAWTRVANEFGNRSDVQCRFKYNYIMKSKKNNSGSDNELNEGLYKGLEHKDDDIALPQQ